MPTRIFSDHASGGPGTSRPVFNAARRACRRGDTLVVWKLDRLGRSLLEVLTVCEDLKTRGVELRILTESIDTNTVMGRFMLHPCEMVSRVCNLHFVKHPALLTHQAWGQAKISPDQSFEYPLFRTQFPSTQWQFPQA
jgi:hypothetical protein